MNSFVSHASMYEARMPVPVAARPVGSDVLELFSVEDVMVDGKVVKQSKFIVDDPSARFAGLKPSDFDLSVQLSTGVELKPTSCSAQSFAEVEAMCLVSEKISRSIVNQSQN